MVLNHLGIAKFQFNTYLISVLVIFFLQVNYEFPMVDQFSVVCSTVTDFKPVLKQLFDFYGTKYEISNHVISTQIGQWQNRHQPQQKDLTSSQMRFVFFLKYSVDSIRHE